MKLTLTIIGVAFEVGGGVLTFWPEVAPRLSRAWERVGRFKSKLVTRIRQLIRHPKTHVVTGAVTAGGVAVGGQASGYAWVPDDAPLERKLRFLIDQAVETQRKFDRVESRLRKLPDEWRQEIAATRSTLEERIAQDLQEARDRFIGRRLTGLFCIVIGSILLGIVNLLP